MRKRSDFGAHMAELSGRREGRGLIILDLTLLKPGFLFPLEQSASLPCIWMALNLDRLVLGVEGRVKVGGAPFRGMCGGRGGQDCA